MFRFIILFINEEKQMKQEETKTLFIKKANGSSLEIILWAGMFWWKIFHKGKQYWMNTKIHQEAFIDSILFVSFLEEFFYQIRSFCRKIWLEYFEQDLDSFIKEFKRS